MSLCILMRFGDCANRKKKVSVPTTTKSILQPNNKIISFTNTFDSSMCVTQLQWACWTLKCQNSENINENTIKLTKMTTAHEMHTHTKLISFVFFFLLHQTQ